MLSQHLRLFSLAKPVRLFLTFGICLLIPLTAHARLASEAAVTGDRRLALRAMMAHPLVNDITAAEEMLDRLIPDAAPA